MARYWHIICGVLALTFLVGCAQAGAERASTPEASASDQTLGEDFRTLRARQGHFSGGSWNRDLDQWQGQKHRTMQELLKRILSGGYDATRMSALLGEPDRILQPADPDYGYPLEQTQWQGQPEGDLWLYHWRGAHDQLVFAVKDGRVLAGGWLYAGE